MPVITRFAAVTLGHAKQSVAAIRNLLDDRELADIFRVILNALGGRAHQRLSLKESS